MTRQRQSSLELIVGFTVFPTSMRAFGHDAAIKVQALHAYHWPSLGRPVVLIKPFHSRLPLLCRPVSCSYRLVVDCQTD
jgi:hypothetical protein